MPICPPALSSGPRSWARPIVLRPDLLSRTDPGLSDELRSLIDAHERAGDFLGVLGKSAPRAMRDLRFAQAWLARELAGER